MINESGMMIKATKVMIGLMVHIIVMTNTKVKMAPNTLVNVC